MRGVGWIIPGLLWSLQVAALPEGIPEPLTLQQALQFAEAAHPQLQIVAAQQREAEAQLGMARSGDALQVDLNGRIRWKSLQQQSDERLADHQLSLSARKSIYDFGRTALAGEIAERSVNQSRLQQEEQVELRKLEIMERFFAVLLADLQRTVEDETMTIAYLRFKKKQDKEITGDYSELDLLQGESRFQDARARQKLAEMNQRLTRIRLAEAMNRPGEIPSMLIAPELESEQRLKTVEEVELLQQQAEASNQALLRSAEQVVQAERQVEQAKLGDQPDLDAAFELFEDSRVTSSKDRWRASLLLEIPLFDGGQQGYAVAAAREQLQIARARHELLKRQIHERIAQYHLQLKMLAAQWQADQIASEYSEIELERNRALYEQEQQSNFGDALVGVSQSHLRSAKSRFELLLTRARLDQIIGKEVVVHE